MPLKLQKRPDRPHFEVRGTYLGVHVSRSTGSGKRAVAQKVLRGIERAIESGQFSRAGGPSFASAALAYMNAGGDRKYVTKLLNHFRDSPLSSIDQAAIDSAAAALYPDAPGATRNRSVYTPVSAILRHSGVVLHLRRPRGAGGAQQTCWLWPEQAFALIEAATEADPEFGALCTVLLYTGLRLSEALGLQWSDVRLQVGYAYIPDTKSGEPRAVFLPPVAVAAFANCGGGRDQGTRAFRFAKGGHLYSLLRVAAQRAGIELPERSAFHIFRHTYATWLRRYAGLDTKGLVATGAWKDTKSADRYAHAVVTEEAQRAAQLPTPKRSA